MIRFILVKLKKSYLLTRARILSIYMLHNRVVSIYGHIICNNNMLLDATTTTTIKIIITQSAGLLLLKKN